MVHFRHNDYFHTLFGKNKITFGQKLFASPKIGTTIHRWRPVFPWLRFIDQTLFALSFLSVMCTRVFSVTGGIMMIRRQL